jgi:Fe2+ or Zn2+ uptake regulation protein
MFDAGTKPAEEMLRSSGVRVTIPRLAVLAALKDGRAHQSAESIVAAVRQSQGSISVQAVYDNLHLLVAHGLIRRIDPAGSAAHYELRVGDNHHHLICRQCGIVHDVDCVVGAAPCLTPSESMDFDVDEAEVTFWGLCPICKFPSSSQSKEKAP